jgi:hypothetical protein
VNAIIAVALVLALVLGAWVWKQQRQDAAAAWPATAGRIVASAVEPVAPPPASRQPPSFVVAVRYEYTVGGRRYEAGRIAFGPPTPYAHGEAAERVRERYPVGGAVTVYYDPQRPDDAVLERGR